MNVINVSQRTPEWSAWRADGVTASEAAVILGRSPYKTPWRLWAERTGVAVAEDLSSKPCVQRGVALEDQARQSFEDRHSTLLLPLCVQSDEHPTSTPIKRYPLELGKADPPSAQWMTAFGGW